MDWVPHIWTIVSGLTPTIVALLSFLKAREASHKASTIIIQTNGTLSRLVDRNHQLLTKLNEHGIVIPLDDFGKGAEDEGNS